jgi:hypothetical protein
MTCSLARSLLDDYTDQELSAGTISTLEEHLKVCSACRAEYDELVSLTSALSKISRPEPPPEYWGEVSELIMARTAEVDQPVIVRSEAEIKAGERSSLYRSVLALAASIAIFASTLWLGSSGPIGLPAFSDQTGSGTDRSTPLAAASQISSTISTDEQSMITGGMLLVGAPGMFAGPAEMAGLLGLDRIR